MSETGAPIPVESLLDQANWVRRLAHSLVRDENEAEDLVQETWLAALKSPPQATGDTKSWFRRVMTNALLQRRRGERARIAREAATALPDRDRAAAPDEIVERAETQRELVGLVLELDEPYRSTLLLRHFDDLQPREIAERMGVSINTANSRLKRAHDQLRDRLERRHGDGWRVALLPVLGWPDAADPVSQTTAVARSARTRRLRWAAGAAVVVAAAAGGWWASRAGESAPDAGHGADPDSARDGAARNAAGRAARGIALDTGSASPPPSPELAASSEEPDREDPPEIALSVSLRTESGEVPARIDVQITPYLARERDVVGEPLTRTAVAGELRIALPALGAADGVRIAEWRLTVDDPRWLPSLTSVRAPLPSEGTAAAASLTLREPAFVVGSVEWDPDSADELAHVASVPLAQSGVDPLETVEVRPGGRFRLRVVPGRAFLAAAAALHRVPAAIQVELAPGAEKDVGVLALARGAEVRGSVTRPKIPFGPSPATRTIAVYSERPRDPFNFRVGAMHLTYTDGAAWFYGMHAPLADDGAFAVGGLPAGPVSLDLQSLGAGLPRECTRRVVDAPAEDVRFVLDGALVEVLVRRDGAAVENARVSLVAADGERCGGRTGADGVARILASPGVAYTASASLEGHTSPRVAVTAPTMDGPAARATLDLARDEVPTARWRVTMRTESGEVPPIAGFAFHPVKDGKPSPRATLVRDVRCEDGVFVLDGVPAGRWRISIRPGSPWHDPAGFFTAPDVEREFAAGMDASDSVPLSPAGRAFVELDFPRRSLVAFTQCRVLGASGGEVPVLFARRLDSGTYYDARQPALDGPSDVIPALAPGRYSFDARAWRDGVEIARTVPFEVLAGRVTRVAVDLR